MPEESVTGGASGDRAAGVCFVFGGACASLWGGALLAMMLALAAGERAPLSGTVLRRAAAANGVAGEALWLAATAGWLAGLVRLTAGPARPVGRWAVLLPAAGFACYAAAGLLAHGVLPGRWPLPVPPTALGTVLWSVGLFAVGLAAVRSRRWRGWTRAVPLLIGVFYFAVPLPLMFVLGHPPVYLLGIGWGALWTAWGMALRREAA
jgi:hypothetical protein